MIDLPWPALAAVAAAVTLGYTVFGFCGFGAGIVVLPLVAHVLPLREAVPMMLVLDIATSLTLGLQSRGLVDRRELLRLVPWLLAGMGVGIVVLARAHETWLLATLGVFVAANAAWSLVGRLAAQPVAPGWAVPAGLVGGTFSAMFGTGGPVYTLFLARRIHDTVRLRATIGTLILLSAALRAVLLVGGGFFAQRGVLPLALAMLPCAAIGYAVGSRWSARVPQDRVRRAIWLLLLASGASLVVRAAVS
mgnify:CR=1 FL=1